MRRTNASNEAGAEKRTVLVDGVRQVYRVAGQGPVCLVHSGGPGIHPGYLRMPELKAHLTVVYLDPVGSGDSDRLPDGDYSVARYGSFAEAVLDDMGTPRGYFLGHSHGGFVALQFGLDHPDRVLGLILYATAPLYGPELWESATEEMAAFVQRWPERPEAAEAGRLWEARRAGNLEFGDGESHERHLNGILPAYFADFRKTLEQVGDITLRVTDDPNRLPVVWDVREHLATIDLPTLVIAGTYDFICPTRFAHEMETEIPRANMCELLESGHYGHIEQSAEFNAAVLHFVRSSATGEPV